MARLHVDPCTNWQDISHFGSDWISISPKVIKGWLQGMHWSNGNPDFEFHNNAGVHTPREVGMLLTTPFAGLWGSYKSTGGVLQRFRWRCSSSRTYSHWVLWPLHIDVPNDTRPKLHCDQRWLWALVAWVDNFLGGGLWMQAVDPCWWWHLFDRTAALGICDAWRGDPMFTIRWCMRIHPAKEQHVQSVARCQKKSKRAFAMLIWHMQAIISSKSKRAFAMLTWHTQAIISSIEVTLIYIGLEVNTTWAAGLELYMKHQCRLEICCSSCLCVSLQGQMAGRIVCDQSWLGGLANFSVIFFRKTYPPIVYET